MAILHNRKINGRAYLVSLAATPPPTPSPSLVINSVIGLVPGGTSIASLAFSRGAPAVALTAVLDGAPLTIANVSVTPASGSGATETGAARFTFTTPPAGSHVIVASSTGPYASQSNSYVFTTTPIILPPPAPSLTVTSITGLVEGAASSALLSFANGAPAPATVTATLDGTPLAITNPSISTTSGSGATASGTVSFTFTAPARGTHTIIVSGAGIYAARSTPYTFTTTARVVLPPPGTAPAALNGIRITQNAPLSPGQKEGTPVAYCDPIDGIGPFLWGLTDPYGLYHMDAVSGAITALSNPIGTATHTLTVACYDGRILAQGPPYSPITRSFTVAKLPDTTPGMAMNSRNPVHNCSLTRNGLPSPQDGPYFAPTAYGADHAFTRDSVGIISQTGNNWVRFTANLTKWNSGKPVAGNYPVTFQATSPTGDVQTLPIVLRVVEFTPVTYIELFKNVPIVSTATLIGTVIGRLLATTPNNRPNWSITDPTGTVNVNQVTGDITLQKDPPVGTFQFPATVADGLANFPQMISIPVQQGTILPAANMTLDVNPALDNSRRNQTIGTPAVTGIPGPKTWVIASQTGYNLQATLDVHFGNPARYQIDKSTGTITTAAATAISSAAMLSYQRTDYDYIPDTITVSCSDGFNTCTRVFPVPVAEAPTTYFHVERGSNPMFQGIQGADITRAQAMAMQHDHPGSKNHFLIYWNPDPDFYTDWTRSSRGFTGPVALQFVSVNGNVPRTGGSAANTVAPSGISTAGGKGHLVFGDGDAEVIGPVIISGVHSSAAGSTTSADAISKDGNTWGNLYVRQARIIDNDQGLHSGNNHGFITVEDSDFCQNGGSQVGAGLTHNLYVGSVSRFTWRGCVSRRVNYGHLFKCRAVETIVDNGRIWDSSSGAAAQCVNLPYIGKVSVTNTHMMKYPFATNPFVVSAGEDGPLYDTNTVSISNSIIDVRAIAYSFNFAILFAVNHWYMAGTTGTPSKITLTGNKAFFAPLTQMTSGDPKWIGGSNATPAPNSTVETGTVALSVPPALDLSDPVLPGNTLPAPGRPFRHRFLGGDNALFPNWLNVLQRYDTEEFRISRAAPLGSSVFSFTATGDIIDNPSGDPFGPGTSYAIISAQLNASNPNPWAPQGAFQVASNADGSGTLKTAATLAPGLYFVQMGATKGTAVSYSRYPVAVT